MLDSHPNISCGPETQFLEDLQRIEEHNWERLVRFGVELSEWRANAAAFFAWIHLEYANASGKTRWADKSPSYALILDYIDSLFPDCQVVHIIRDPRDVTRSYRERWGPIEALKNPRRWVAHVRNARAWGLSHPEGRYIEIRYEALVNEPEGTLRHVLRVLDEPWDDSVLHFGEIDHARAGKLSPPYSPGGQASGDRSVVYRSSIGAGRHTRDLGHRIHLQLVAGRLMKDLGY